MSCCDEWGSLVSFVAPVCFFIPSAFVLMFAVALGVFLVVSLVFFLSGVRQSAAWEREREMKKSQREARQQEQRLLMEGHEVTTCSLVYRRGGI